MPFCCRPLRTTGSRSPWPWLARCVSVWADCGSRWAETWWSRRHGSAEWGLHRLVGLPFVTEKEDHGVFRFSTEIVRSRHTHDIFALKRCGMLPCCLKITFLSWNVNVFPSVLFRFAQIHGEAQPTVKHKKKSCKISTCIRFSSRMKEKLIKRCRNSYRHPKPPENKATMNDGMDSKALHGDYSIRWNEIWGQAVRWLGRQKRRLKSGSTSQTSFKKDMASWRCSCSCWCTRFF